MADISRHETYRLINVVVCLSGNQTISENGENQNSNFTKPFRALRILLMTGRFHFTEVCWRDRVLVRGLVWFPVMLHHVTPHFFCCYRCCSSGYSPLHSHWHLVFLCSHHAFGWHPVVQKVTIINILTLPDLNWSINLVGKTGSQIIVCFSNILFNVGFKKKCLFLILQISSTD